MTGFAEHQGPFRPKGGWVWMKVLEICMKQMTWQCFFFEQFFLKKTPNAGNINIFLGVFFQLFSIFSFWVQTTCPSGRRFHRWIRSSKLRGSPARWVLWPVPWQKTGSFCFCVTKTTNLLTCFDKQNQKTKKTKNKNTGWFCLETFWQTNTDYCTDCWFKKSVSCLRKRVCKHFYTPRFESGGSFYASNGQDIWHLGGFSKFGYNSCCGQSLKTAQAHSSSARWRADFKSPPVQGTLGDVWHFWGILGEHFRKINSNVLIVGAQKGPESDILIFFVPLLEQNLASRLVQLHRRFLKKKIPCFFFPKFFPISKNPIVVLPFWQLHQEIGSDVGWWRWELFHHRALRWVPLRQDPAVPLPFCGGAAPIQHGRC